MNYQDKWQNNICFTMNNILIGTGWSKVLNKNNSYFRSIYHGSFATLHLKPKRDVINRINIKIFNVSNLEILKKLNIEANGIPLKLFFKDEQLKYLSCILPSDTSIKEGEETIFKFKLNDKGIKSEYKKFLNKEFTTGIDIEQIDIFPLKRPFFTILKSQDNELFDGLRYLHKHKDIKDLIFENMIDSAYQYHKEYENEDLGCCQINESFDECPGDNIDMIMDIIEKKLLYMQSNILNEIGILREIIIIQGEIILDLRKKINNK